MQSSQDSISRNVKLIKSVKEIPLSILASTFLIKTKDQR